MILPSTRFPLSNDAIILEVDTAMNATTASATPVDQVDELVKMVADENNLELGEAFGDLGPVGKIKEPARKNEVVPVQDDLEARLANLRG